MTRNMRSSAWLSPAGRTTMNQTNGKAQSGIAGLDDDESRLIIEQIDAAELSPGEFANRVRRIVDHENLHTVVIDSLNGYQAAQGVLRGVPQYAGGRAPLLADENP